MVFLLLQIEFVVVAQTDTLFLLIPPLNFFDKGNFSPLDVLGVAKLKVKHQIT